MRKIAKGIVLLGVLLIGVILLLNDRKTAKDFSPLVFFWDRGVDTRVVDNRTGSSSQPPVPGTDPVQVGNEFFYRLASFGVDRWLKASFSSNALAKEEVELVNHTYLVAADLLVQPLPLPDTISPPPIPINCSNPIYADALTGKLDPHNKTIVDVALFGWDADFLEIRLLEYADLIDVFVIPEQDITHKGIPKPLLVPSLLEGRLASFRHKIDYMPQSYAHFFENMYDHGKNGQVHKMWQLENGIRNDAFNYVKKKFENMENVYTIQNDGDELISRRAMAHFKACELREPSKLVSFPCTLFKRNTAWLQETYDRRTGLTLHAEHAKDDIKILVNYMWATAPRALSLADSIVKDVRGGWRNGFRHMGLGAANHFSSPCHPIMDFMKRLSTVETTPARASRDFWERALQRNLTNVDLRRPTFDCRMDTSKSFKFWPVGDMNETLIHFIVENLPWSLREMPNRYPYLYKKDLFEYEKQMQACVCHDECSGLLLKHQ